MATKFLNDTGLAYFWGKIKAWVTDRGYITSSGSITGNAATATRLAGPKHSYTTAANAAKNWYRIANANTHQMDTSKPLQIQFMLTAWNPDQPADYYLQWFVDCQVYGRNSGIRIFGTSGAPFNQARVLYENTTANIDTTDRPAIDIYLNYVLTTACQIRVEEIYNSGWTFISDGVLASSTVPSGFENRTVGVYASGVSNAAFCDYAARTRLGRSNITANATLANNDTYHARILNCTNAITITVPSIDSDYAWFLIKNFNAASTNKDVTIHPSTTSVLIDDSNADIVLKPGEWVIIASKAANSYTLIGDGRWKSQKADDSAVVHNTDNETIAGTKTFSNTVVAPRFDGAVSMYKLDAPTNENSSGTVSTGLRSLIDNGRSCKTAFIPAANITIEYSIDGSTWLDYGASNEDKQKLFAMYGGYSGFNVMLGKGLANVMNTNCKLRVTIVPADRYASVDMLYLFVCAYNHTMKVDIERSTIGAKTTFASVRAGTQISGWSGPNVVSFPVGTFGGGSNQTSNSYAYRFTFYCTAIGSNTNYPNVQDIRMYGSTTWTSANRMMKSDHLYSWDYAQNATFPAQVTATKFIGALQGNADTASAVVWSGVTSKPTTIAGYGITDANIANGTITLGSNSITPLTSHQALPTLSRTISGSGNAITDITVSNHAITATKGNTFALDSGVVHTTENESISGIKTFSNVVNIDHAGLIIASRDMSINKGTAPAATAYNTIVINDKNGTDQKNRLGFFETFVEQTTGKVCTQIAAYKNEANSTDYVTLSLWHFPDGTSFAACPTPPASSNGTSVATTKWVNDKGYITSSSSITGTAANVTGIVAVENGGTGSDTKNFVDLSTDQSVAGVKTFTNSMHHRAGSPAFYVEETSSQGFGDIRFVNATGSTDAIEALLRHYPGGQLQLGNKRTGGDGWTSGGLLQFYANGNFELRANGGTARSLLGYGNGTLTWNGQTVQTSSDERIKTPLASVPDEVLDAWEDVQWGQFQFLDAVSAKGEGARLHLGLVAQRVRAVFEAHGLDACEYGILCHEERSATSEEPAVDLWMVRYTEALAMEAACQRRRADRLEARIAALEERLNG